MMCSCGDRLASECPGEWEPECDLGNNEKYAVAAPLRVPYIMLDGESYTLMFNDENNQLQKDTK